MLNTISLLHLKKKLIKIPLSTLFFEFLKIYTTISEKFYIILNDFFLLLQKLFHFTSVFGGPETFFQKVKRFYPG